ncbi:uncharacterized protein LOC134787077 [Penaeus indicus]|uniref:uncharacterized protein LOC134787077 n=1 Tax=Penaeus indicus TaxID=29960 RepID=UPI00300C9485
MSTKISMAITISTITAITAVTAQTVKPKCLVCDPDSTLVTCPLLGCANAWDAPSRRGENRKEVVPPQTRANLTVFFGLRISPLECYVAWSSWQWCWPLCACAWPSLSPKPRAAKDRAKTGSSLAISSVPLRVLSRVLCLVSQIRMEVITTSTGPITTTSTTTHTVVTTTMDKECDVAGLVTRTSR